MMRMSNSVCVMCAYFAPVLMREKDFLFICIIYIDKIYNIRKVLQQKVNNNNSLGK